jgi:hypothetical protein
MPEPLSDKIAGILLSMFQDVYRQEIGAEEDVHRTLPFFATALGLIITALVFAVGHLPSWAELTKSCPASRGIDRWFACRWPVLISDALLAVAICACFGVLWYLAAATKRQGYERVGPEEALFARARELQAHHSGLGLTDTVLDNAVAASLREQLLEDYAEVISLNRSLTLQRYRLRARAVSFLLWSLFAAVAATIFLIVTAEFGLMKVTPP